VVDENEANGVAKIIAKWTHLEFKIQSVKKYIEKTHSSEIQSMRGEKLSGYKRRKWSIEETKLWEKDGVSRRTYFYRRKK